MKKTEFTKTAIINSTVKLLKANGKVTIKEISDDAGVNIAAINYHFTDKKSLISVVIRRTISDFKKIADNLVANLAELNTHPEETISAFFNACHEYCAENINVINFMLAPENVEYNNYFNKTVSQMFSTDSDLCFKVISYMRDKRGKRQRIEGKIPRPSVNFPDSVFQHVQYLKRQSLRTNFQP